PPPCTVQFREISEAIPRAVQVSIDLRVIEGPPRVCTEQLEREEGVAVQTQASVNAREMIVLLDEIGAGRGQSEARLIADVAPDAPDSGVSVVVDEPGDCRELRRIVSLVFGEIARGVVARQESAEIRAAAFAGQLQRHVGVDDRPRMERPNGRAEDVSAFEEKGPPLFEEQWETLVGSDLRLVGFDFGEIRIDREIESDAWRQCHFPSQTRIGGAWLIDE